MKVTKHDEYILVELNTPYGDFGGEAFTVEMAEDLSLMNQNKTIVVSYPDYLYVIAGKGKSLNPDKVGDLIK